MSCDLAASLADTAFQLAEELDTAESPRPTKRPRLMSSQVFERPGTPRTARAEHADELDDENSSGSSSAEEELTGTATRPSLSEREGQTQPVVSSSSFDDWITMVIKVPTAIEPGAVCKIFSPDGRAHFVTVPTSLPPGGSFIKALPKAYTEEVLKTLDRSEMKQWLRHRLEALPAAAARRWEAEDLLTSYLVSAVGLPEQESQVYAAALVQGGRDSVARLQELNVARLTAEHGWKRGHALKLESLAGQAGQQRYDGGNPNPSGQELLRSCVRWLRDAKAKVLGEAAALAASTDSTGGTSESEWQPAWSGTYERQYWWHRVTRATAWEKPTDDMERNNFPAAEHADAEPVPDEKPAAARSSGDTNEETDEKLPAAGFSSKTGEAEGAAAGAACRTNK